MNWLSEDLQEEIKSLFEPKYKHELSSTEVENIAINLTDGLEVLLKHKFQNEYGKVLQN